MAFVRESGSLTKRAGLTKSQYLTVERYLNQYFASELLSISVNGPDAAKDALKVQNEIIHQFATFVRTRDAAKNILNEMAGLGIISDLLKAHPDITDIGWNGVDLWYEGIDGKQVYKPKPTEELNNDVILRIIQKFANGTGKDFTAKTPILDAVFQNLRINAVYKTQGTSQHFITMSLRVVKARLALNKSNFHVFGPDNLLPFLYGLVRTGVTIIISGEVGTGKTEFQKLLIHAVPVTQKLIMIEDVEETHLKEIYPDKDIIDWITSESVTITDLIKASLRNNPKWIMVAEVRGQEAFEMIQAVLSGHMIITTVHAVDARAIPDRLINMAKQGPQQIDGKTMKTEIFRYFNFGMHIKRIKVDGKTVRFLNEIVEFGVKPDKDGVDRETATTIFYQTIVNGHRSFEYRNPISTRIFATMLETDDLDFLLDMPIETLPKYTVIVRDLSKYVFEALDPRMQRRLIEHDDALTQAQKDDLLSKLPQDEPKKPDNGPDDGSDVPPAAPAQPNAKPHHVSERFDNLRRAAGTIATKTTHTVVTASTHAAKDATETIREHAPQIKNNFEQVGKTAKNQVDRLKEPSAEAKARAKKIEENERKRREDNDRLRRVVSSLGDITRK